MAKNSNLEDSGMLFFINFNEVSSKHFIVNIVPELARHREFLEDGKSLTEEMQMESTDLFLELLTGARFIDSNGDVYTIRERGTQFF